MDRQYDEFEEKDVSKSFIYTEEQVREMWNRPFEEQYEIALAKCLEAITRMDGDIAVSFSGGKDSAVLLYICATAWTLTKHKSEPLRVFFANTTNEFASAYQYRKNYISYIEQEFDIKIEYHETHADKNYFDVVHNIGYPFVSKKVSRMVRDAQTVLGELSLTYAELEPHMPKHYTKNHVDEMIAAADYLRGLGVSDTVVLNLTMICSNNRIGRRFLPVQYRPLIDSEFKLSEQCCSVLKKVPIKKAEKEMGSLLPVTGEMAEESRDRMEAYRATGCNNFDGKRPKSKPLGPMTEQAVLNFITTRNIPIMAPYGELKQTKDGRYYLTGEQRTGCKLCGFGLMFDPDRFIRLQKIEPNVVQFAFTSRERGGLGYRELCEFLNERCGMSIGIPEIEEGYYKNRTA